MAIANLTLSYELKTVDTLYNSHVQVVEVYLVISVTCLVRSSIHIAPPPST